MLAASLLLLSKPPRAEIQIAYDRWNAAYIQQNVTALDILLANDFVAYRPTKKNWDKTEFLGGIMREFASPGPKLTKFVTTIERLEPTKSGWMATIFERWTFGTQTGGQVTMDGWRDSGHGWQIVSTRFVRRLKGAE